MISSKNRRELLDFLVKFLPRESIYSSKACKALECAIYISHYVPAFSMLFIICLQVPSLLKFSNKYHQIFFFLICAIRAALSLFHILQQTHHHLLYLLSQIAQIVSLFLLQRTLWVTPLLLLELGSDSIYCLGKGQRKGNFDSRLHYSSLFIKMALIKSQNLIFNHQQHCFSFLLYMQIINIAILITACSDLLYVPFVKRLFINASLFLISLYAYLIGYLWWNGTDQVIQDSQLIFALLPIVAFFLMKQHFEGDPINLQIFNQNVLKVCASKKREYFLESIKVLEKHDLKMQQKLDLINIHKKDCKTLQCQFNVAHGVKSESFQRDFYNSTLKKLFSCFSYDPFLISIFFFYFHAESGSKFIKYLSKDDFFHKREMKETIFGSHPNELVEKMELRDKIERNVVYLSQLYLQNFGKLLDLIQEETINIKSCETTSIMLLQLKEKLFQIGYISKQKLPMQQKFGSSRQFEQEETETLIQSSGKVTFSDTTRIILNFFKTQIFEMGASMPENINKSQLIRDREDSLALISLNEEDYGTIISVNKSLCRMLNYFPEDLIGEKLEVFLLHEMRKGHKKMLKEKSFHLEPKGRVRNATIFIIKKSGLCSVCSFSSQMISGHYGRRIIASFTEIEPDSCFIVCNSEGKVVTETQKSAMIFNGDRMTGKTFDLSMIEGIKNADQRRCCFFCIPGTSYCGSYELSIPLYLQIPKNPYLPNYEIIQIKKKIHTSHHDMSTFRSGGKETDFQFSYDLFNNAFTNRQKSPEEKAIDLASCFNEIEEEQTQQMWELKEDISELIYMNGELEFRENKKLEENGECETHPFHLQADERILDIESKGKFNEIVEKEGSKISNEVLSIALLLTLFYVILISLSISTSLMVSSSYQITEKKTQIHILINTRLERYSQLFVILSEPIWTDSQVLQIFQDYGLVDLTNILMEVEEISDKISEIDKGFQEWSYERYFPPISLDTQLKDIKQNVQIEISKLLESDAATIPLKKIQILKKIIKYLMPISLYIDQQIQLNYSNQTDQEITKIYVCIGTAGFFALFFGILTVVQLRVIRDKYVEALKTLAFFQDTYLGRYSQKIKEIQNCFSDINKIDTLNEKLEQEEDLIRAQDPELPKKKRVVYKFEKDRLKIFIWLVAFLIAMLPFIILNIEMIDQIREMDKIKHLSDCYHLSLVNQDLFWIKTVIKSQFNANASNLVTQVFSEDENLWSKSREDIEREESNMIYWKTRSLAEGYYDQSFIQQYNNTIMGPLCHIFSHVSNCTGDFGQQYAENIEQLIQIIHDKILKNHEYYQTMKNWGVQKKIHKHVIRFILFYQEKIFDIAHSLINHQTKDFREDINVSIIMSSILLAFLISLFIMFAVKILRGVHERQRIPLRILSEVFPLPLLCKNKKVKKWYHEKKVHDL